jgi:hypothetical protein
MNCPSEQLLLAAALGELTGSEASQVNEHVKRCSHCSLLAREQVHLLIALKTGPESPKSENDFINGVMARCESICPVAVPSTRRKRSFLYAMAAVVSAFALWFVHHSTRSHLDVFTARGTANHDLASVTADVLYLRGAVVSPVEQAELHPGDRIAVRYWNGSASPFYLAVFAVDTQNTVHWVFPAYLDASQNPSSVPLTRSVEGRVFDEVVEPEKPADGAFKIVALVTSTPLTVHDVETRVSGNHRPLSELFPQARVQEWNCTWHTP